MSVPLLLYYISSVFALQIFTVELHQNFSPFKDIAYILVTQFVVSNIMLLDSFVKFYQWKG